MELLHRFVAETTALREPITGWGFLAELVMWALTWWLVLHLWDELTRWYAEGKEDLKIEVVEQDDPRIQGSRYD